MNEGRGCGHIGVERFPRLDGEGLAVRCSLTPIRRTKSVGPMSVHFHPFQRPGFRARGGT